MHLNSLKRHLLASEGGQQCLEALPKQPHSIASMPKDWQHRIGMRQKAIIIVKESMEYQSCSESRRGKGHGDGEPKTPDPMDQTVSKRQWKFAVQAWRAALTQHCLEDGRASVASTEEWQSIS